MGLVSPIGSKIDFKRDPIFESAAWFFVIILKFIFTSNFEIEIYEKNSFTPKKLKQFFYDLYIKVIETVIITFWRTNSENSINKFDSEKFGNWSLNWSKCNANCQQYKSRKCLQAPCTKQSLYQFQKCPADKHPNIAKCQGNYILIIKSL